MRCFVTGQQSRGVLHCNVISAYLLFFIKLTPAFGAECLSPNVRTVLWHNTDLYRSCWNDHDIAVLYARRLFQLIIPTRVPSDIPALIAHFKMCLEVVKDLATTRETHQMMLKSMADAIGGYLQSFGIPIANQEYYEGNLTYSTANQMNELLMAIKKILSTDGGKWTQPITVLPSLDICPFEVVPPTPIENHCIDLITSLDLRTHCKVGALTEVHSTKIPLPFLDNSVAPKAIAVPFRAKTLYNIFEKDSSDILMRYYTAASHCFALHCGSDGFNTPEHLNFDKAFHDWLVKSVVPHLHDGKWYPAFRGVYRILKTLADKGLEFPNYEEPRSIVGQCLSKSVAKTSWFFFTCVFGFLAIFWFVVFVLHRTRKKHGKRCRMNEDDVINYSEKCETSHSQDLIDAIVKSIIDDPSASSVFLPLTEDVAACNCYSANPHSSQSNESMCFCENCACVKVPPSTDTLATTKVGIGQKASSIENANRSQMD